MTKKKKATRKKKSAGNKTGTRRSKPARRKKMKRPGKRSVSNQRIRNTRQSPPVSSLDAATLRRRGFGARSAGQSGDTQGLSNLEEADSESVEELIEEGQSFEASVVAGVEDADADQREVRSKQVREDDVPREYLDKD